MNVLDARDNPIHLGSYVRYTRTGTISEVTAIETNNNNYWIRLDKTELWYLPKYLEVLNEKDFNSNVSNFKDRQSEVNVDNIKDIRDDFENIELSSNVAEGGG